MSGPSKFAARTSLRIIMLVSQLFLSGVVVAVLCNPQPPLTTVQDLVCSYWNPVSAALQEAAQLHPLNVPASLKFESEIEAFLLVNLDSQTCLTSLRPPGLSLRTTLSAGECVWCVCMVRECSPPLQVSEAK